MTLYIKYKSAIHEHLIFNIIQYQLRTLNLQSYEFVSEIKICILLSLKIDYRS